MRHSISLEKTSKPGVFMITDNQQCLGTFDRKTVGFYILLRLVYENKISTQVAEVLAREIYDTSEIKSHVGSVFEDFELENDRIETVEIKDYDLKYLNTIIFMNEMCSLYEHITVFPAVYQCHNCVSTPHARIVVCKPRLEKIEKNDTFLFRLFITTDFYYKDDGIEIVNDLCEEGEYSIVHCDRLITEIWKLDLPGSPVEKLN